MVQRRKRRAGLYVTLAVVATLVAAGCDDNHGNPAALVDTTGELFSWTCDSDGCDAEPEGDLVVTCGGEPNDGFLYARDRFVELCPAWADFGLAATYGELCRIVACEESGDCPQFASGRYECENGLCQRRDHDGTLRARDALLLCLADVPRAADCVEGASSPAVVEAYDAIADACGVEVGAVCPEVPERCRAP